MRAVHFSLAAAVLALSGLTCVQAEQFDIPARPLADALRVLADQAKMQLLYQPDAVGNGTSNAVSGELDKRAALQRLLKDTGFEVIFSREDAATVRPAGEPRTAGSGADVKLAQTGRQTSSTEEKS